MGMVYFDNKTLESAADIHPAFILDRNSRCFRMERVAIKGKSVFDWRRDEALAMYDWYFNKHLYDLDIVNEFGEKLGYSEFKNIIQKSHYMDDEFISEETIQELWDSSQEV